MNEELKQIDSALTILPLGAGLEVGRSCIVLNYLNKSVMFDCGLHMSKEGLDALPYFDYIDPQSIDLILITHFHLDHCGALPHFLNKTNFKGKVYMTSPTKAIYRHVLRDSTKIRSENIKLYSKEDVDMSMRRIEVINYHQEFEYNGIKFKCYCAGHVLGAAMFQVEINGVRVLYTGDYSREEDRLILPAEIPNEKVDILIVESTYGNTDHEPRLERESRLTKEIHDIVKVGGKCLMPVLALGRAEELLLILEEYWASHPELQEVGIYYTAALFQKFKEVFQYFINMMAEPIKKKIFNPFNLKHSPNEVTKVELIKQIQKPCVVLASPGMLQSGTSKELFDEWKADDRNGVIITGYCVDGTLAHKLQYSKQSVDGLKMKVTVISFSAHADAKQTIEFITKIDPCYVILVHGHESKAKELKQKLEKVFPNIKKFLSPKNGEKEQFYFDLRQSCKIVGQMEEEIQQQIQEHINQAQQSQQLIQTIPVQGIMYRDDQNVILFNQDDKQIHQNLNLTQGNLIQKLYIPYKGDIELIYFFAEQIMGSAKIQTQQGQQYCIVRQDIQISIFDESNALIEWISSKKNDVIVDNFSLLLSQFAENPIKQEDNSITLIKKLYSNSICKMESDIIIVRDDNNQDLASIIISTKEVITNNEVLKARLNAILQTDNEI